jgi:hypothetical protein
MKPKIIDLKYMEDQPRSDLTIMEFAKALDFVPKRMIQAFNWGYKCNRKSKASLNCDRIFTVCDRANIVFSLSYFENKELQHETFWLSNPYEALYIPRGTWTEIYCVGGEGLMTVLLSESYEDEKVIRDWAEFMAHFGGRK